jgi:hypothetical protein
MPKGKGLSLAVSKEGGKWYLAMLVATTRLRASECRAENRAIAVALMITGFRRWLRACNRPN